jgi:Tol biopolymer transport system component
MNVPPFQDLPADPTLNGRLDSWKKIARYLKRDVSTVQRWERREGMPVHRHLHDKLGSVYAYRSEIDQWWAGRAARLTHEAVVGAEAAAKPVVDDVADSTAPASPVPAGGSLARWLGIGLAVAAVTGALYWALQRSDYWWSNPLANARFQLLTDFEGTENSAVISRDGTQVAFLADRDGQMDVWTTRVGSGTYRNLTKGSLGELVNSSIRTLGFSPDGTMVSIWSRQADGSKPEDINLLAAPLSGEPLRHYLDQAAEYDWSTDGRIVYHSTAPGDPTYIRGPHDEASHHLYTAPPGIHCHFPIFAPDGAQVYFMCGRPPDKWDIWRIATAGGSPERLTALNTHMSHPVFLNSNTLAYLATDQDGMGPWLYALDLRRRISRRLTSGIERYTSLSASADGMRLVVTVDARKNTLWQLPVARTGGTEGSSGAAAAAAATASFVRLPLDGSHATAARIGPDYVLYVNTEGGSSGLWKLAHGATTSVWRDARARVVGAPAIAPDGRHIAFVAEADGRTQLRLIRDDGADGKVLVSGLELRGTPAWAPDGQSLLCAVEQDGTPRLYRIPLKGGAPVQLISEYSIDPSWSPDGKFLVYSGADVGTTFPLRAAAADGRAYPIHSVVLTRGARRVAFFGDSHTLLVLRGSIEHKDFWLVDLDSGAEHQRSVLPDNFMIGDFDLAPDGRSIVFDRVQATSDLVLIDRAQ